MKLILRKQSLLYIFNLPNSFVESAGVMGQYSEFDIFCQQSAFLQGIDKLFAMNVPLLGSHDNS